MNKKITSYRIIALGIWFALLLLSSLVPLAALHGSFKFMLSGINVLMPIAGAFCGLTGVSMLFCCLWTVKALVLSLPITVGIPSLFGMASWSSAQNNGPQPLPHYLINVILPALCMLIFALHPTAAFPYALYWLIPVAIGLQSHQNIFLLALQSTFVMHAVGSIMWLFLMPMTNTQWLALIPVVAAERLGMAVLSVCAYQLIIKTVHYLHAAPASSNKN